MKVFAYTIDNDFVYLGQFKDQVECFDALACFLEDEKSELDSVQASNFEEEFFQKSKILV